MIFLILRAKKQVLLVVSWSPPRPRYLLHQTIKPCPMFEQIPVWKLSIAAFSLMEHLLIRMSLPNPTDHHRHLSFRVPLLLHVLLTCELLGKETLRHNVAKPAFRQYKMFWCARLYAWFNNGCIFQRSIFLVIFKFQLLNLALVRSSHSLKFLFCNPFVHDAHKYP